MSQAELSRPQVQAVIECILLAAEEPVTANRLCELLVGYKPRDVRDLVDALNARYQDHGHGFTIVQVAGGYQFATRPDLGSWVRRFHQDRTHMRLSQAALEALAIVAFKQPVTRVEIDSIRGVNSAAVLQKLMELELIRIVGRSEGLGRPMLFGTTREFLVHFGLNSLADLPKPKELDELLAAGELKAQDREQLALTLAKADRGAAAGGEAGAQAPPSPADDADEPAGAPVQPEAAAGLTDSPPLPAEENAAGQGKADGV